MGDERTPLLGDAHGLMYTSNAKLFLAVFSAVLGNFNFGFSMVYPSSAIPQLKNIEDPRLRMDTDMVSWFGSVFTLGAAAGGLSAMVLNDKIGRKLCIMMSGVPSAVGYLVMGSAQATWMLLLGRFLTGIAGGMTAASIPIYVSEISHPRVRGILGSCPQVTAVVGTLSLYALGLVLPWRWLAVAGEVPTLIMLILLCFMPDSPRYLIAKGRKDKALQSLAWLRGSGANYMTEFNKIEQSVATQGKISFLELRTPFYYKPILIAVGMRFLQQMTGITPILVYLEPIFNMTKVILPGQYDAAIVGAVRLVSVLIAASLMDKAGRKALLYISGFLMFLSTLTMCLYTHTNPLPIHYINISVTSDFIARQPETLLQAAPPSLITLIPLISTMLIIFGYAMGWGPITWLLMSEILPLGARGVASGLCVGVSWVTAFALTQLFMKVVDAYGLFVPFLFFSVVCVVNIIFTAVCVPETKGHSLEDIENYFRFGRVRSINTT
ncbi:solute carrier family 2, facilitated glucose transporter member 6 [Amia ocellicauda]|uniref:solute carrier family 2, facilitated glucose transporter member 6 n=1 Tax=Amia ocellicauda TaxID=2972642 RepID=UPI0034642545